MGMVPWEAKLVRGNGKPHELDRLDVWRPETEADTGAVMVVAYGPGPLPVHYLRMSRDAARQLRDMLTAALGDGDGDGDGQTTNRG